MSLSCPPWALGQCRSRLVHFQRWCLISSKTAVHHLLGPCHFLNPMMPCLDKTVKKYWRENNSHWRNRCWNVSAPISAYCVEKREACSRQALANTFSHLCRGVSSPCGQGHFRAGHPTVPLQFKALSMHCDLRSGIKKKVLSEHFW